MSCISFQVRLKADVLVYQPIPHLGLGMKVAHWDRVLRVLSWISCVFWKCLLENKVSRDFTINYSVCVIVNLSQLGAQKFSIHAVRSHSALLCLFLPLSL